MSEAGLRAKSRTHGTAPTYKRLRRNKASITARIEKQAERQARAGQGEQVTLLDLWACARRAMGTTHLPVVYLKREDHR